MNPDRSNRFYRSSLSKLGAVSAAGMLTLWGILAIYRTQMLMERSPYFLLRQVIWAAAAWGIFGLFLQIKFKTLCRMAFFAAASGIVLLAALPLFGLRINGMRGWYELGFFTLQPSEIFKAFYLLYLVQVLHMRNLPAWGRLFAASGGIGCFVLLLLMQPDFGTMIVYLAGGFAALYFSGVKMRILWLFPAAAIPAAVTAVALHSYMRSRILHFLQPELDPTGGSWHLRQFAIAIARGEFSGVKDSMAVWSNSFLPLAHNDSIFAALCEMQGLAGGVLILLLYIWLFYNLTQLAQLQISPLRRSLIDSINAMLIIQTLLHILVNTGSIPPTGITLPLISYGGSSLLGTMLLLGTAMNAAQTQEPIGENRQ